MRHYPRDVFLASVGCRTVTGQSSSLQVIFHAPQIMQSTTSDEAARKVSYICDGCGNPLADDTATSKWSRPAVNIHKPVTADWLLASGPDAHPCTVITETHRDSGYVASPGQYGPAQAHLWRQLHPRHITAWAKRPVSSLLGWCRQETQIVKINRVPGASSFTQ